MATTPHFLGQADAAHLGIGFILFTPLMFQIDRCFKVLIPPSFVVDTGLFSPSLVQFLEAFPDSSRLTVLFYYLYAASTIHDWKHRRYTISRYDADRIIHLAAKSVQSSIVGRTALYLMLRTIGKEDWKGFVHADPTLTMQWSRK